MINSKKRQLGVSKPQKKYHVKMQFHTFDYIEVNAKNRTDAIRVAQELVARNMKDFVSIYDLSITTKETYLIDENGYAFKEVA